METASVPEASARVIAALSAAGRSRTTIKRHEAELNAFARFLQARGQGFPAEADCLDFVAQRSGCRLAGLREPASSRQAQLARRPLVLLMECLDGGMPRVGQATAPLADRCPPCFRAARDEYLAACRRRRNAEASVVTKQRAADAFLAYLEEAGLETLGQAQARALAGFWARRQNRGYAMIVRTARLGLRVGDLRRLEVGWSGWRAKTLTLTQHKTGLPLRLPVPGDVGWAGIDYIRHGRPQAGCAQGVLKHRYPFTAFGSSSSAGCRLGDYARRAGIVFPARRYHGLHSLRGALAVAMLQAGPPPPVVPAVLGQAAATTTAAHYLRLDTEHLRRCALDVEDVLAGHGARS